MDSTAVVLERVQTARGELVLRRHADRLEVISNGVFLMDTASGSSERLLVRAALDAVPDGTRLLIGGLGVGFSLAESVGRAGLASIVVVEIEPAIAAWHRTHLAPFGEGALDDPRVRLVTADLVDWLRRTTETFDAICLDIDNGPDWTTFEANAGLYDDAGLAVLRSRLAPGGVLAVWSASRSPAFAHRVERLIGPVRRVEVEVPRGEPDVVYLAHRT